MPQPLFSGVGVALVTLFQDDGRLDAAATAGHAACLVELGIRAVVCQSFERIHRSNLIGMGVIPLVFEENTSWQSIGIKGDEQVTIRGLPVRLGKTPGTVRSLGPELGQDTELILAETLGYTWEQIGELKEQGAIP